MKHSGTSKLLGSQDLADVLGCTVGALRQRLRRGLAPQPFRFGSKMVWRPEDIDAWLEQQASAAGAAYSAAPQPHNHQPEEDPPRRRRGRPKGSRKEV